MVRWRGGGLVAAEAPFPDWRVRRGGRRRARARAAPPPPRARHTHAPMQSACRRRGRRQRRNAIRKTIWHPLIILARRSCKRLWSCIFSGYRILCADTGPTGIFFCLLRRFSRAPQSTNLCFEARTRPAAAAAAADFCGGLLNRLAGSRWEGRCLLDFFNLGTVRTVHTAQGAVPRSRFWPPNGVTQGSRAGEGRGSTAGPRGPAV